MSARALALAAAFAATTVQAQERCDYTPAELIAEAIRIRSVDLGLYAEPLQSPPSSEVAASQETTTDDPVPDASFPALVAMHLGVPTSSSDTGAITFDLTPFSVVAVRDPDVIDKQSEYAKYENLRRIGLALSLGGTGEAFDRDGDGVVDDALEAEDMGDIVSAELRYRFAGSRDRRDPANAKNYFDATKEAYEKAGDAFGEVSRQLVPILLASAPGESKLYCPSDAEKLATSHARILDAKAGTIASFMERRDEVLEAIDGAIVWTAVAGLTERKEDFGPDLWWAGIRGAGGLGPDMGWSFSLDYGATESLANGDDAKRIKAGLEWATLLAKKWVGRDGVRASVSAAYEKWQDVPDATDDDITQLNFKVNFPLTDTISIPLSITYANKKELLQDESEMRGYIGFTFDFDGALRKALLGPSE
jgi:hypothetical protein